MSGLISGLAGAGGAANTAGGYYNNAANEIVSATGSPAAKTFSAEEMAALRPQFANALDQASGAAAAQGITGSGANRASLGNVTAQDSATLASNVAPLYQQALGQYGSIIGNMPGAQNQAYNQAIQNFYNSIGGAASTAGEFFGLPGGGGGQGPNTGAGNSYGASTGYYEPGDAGGVSNTPYIP